MQDFRKKVKGTFWTILGKKYMQFLNLTPSAPQVLQTKNSFYSKILQKYTLWQSYCLL